MLYRGRVAATAFSVLGTTVGLYLVAILALVVAGRRETARAVAGFVPHCLVLFARLLREPRVPWRRRVLLGAVIPYLAMPFDLVPDFVPVAGQIDDALVVAFAMRHVARGNPELVRELWPGPRESLELLLRLVGVKRPTPR